MRIIEALTYSLVGELELRSFTGGRHAEDPDVLVIDMGGEATDVR